MGATVTMYALDELRGRIDEQLLESEGELTPEIEAALDSWNVTADEKIERVGLYVREQIANADALDNHPIVLEAKRLQARAAMGRKRAENLKAYLLRNMIAWGKSKVEGLLLTVALQKNSAPAITCDSPETVHAGEQGERFVEVVTDFRLRRDAIIAAWKAKTSLPAGVTVVQGQHVRLR